MEIHSEILTFETRESFELINLSAQIASAITSSGISRGLAIISSQHTTTALFVNEHEQRLVEDIKIFFSRLVPANRKYLHNDIHLRDCDPDEPENAHSHILAMLLNNSEVITIVNGKMSLGQWQSVMLVELDGPRKRSVQVQIIGENS